MFLQEGKPGQACWPSLQEWNAFNKTVSGRLKIPVMLSSPCFPSSPNFDANICASVLDNYENGTFRESTYGAQQITQWEACGSANCYPGIVPPQGPTCSLGRISPLYVDAETPADITATLGFTKRHGIRIVVKNTGHDYLGRSAAANTLGLRTHNMKNMTFASSFKAHNCTVSNRQNIGIIGAGVNAEEALAFFEKHGVMVTVGGCPTVGIAGGFGQGGGHGPLGPTHGLMVDQAVEFDVVTTDGVFRTINACNEPDLFWAMRGGGGQSYAILVNYKFQLYPQTQWATWRLEATLTPGSSNTTHDTVLGDILKSLSKEQPKWSQNRVAGYDMISPTAITFLEVLPAGGNPLPTLKNLTANFNSFLTKHPSINISVNSYQVYQTQQAFYTGQADYIARGGTVGASILVPSRLITTDNFESSSKIDALGLGEALAPQVAFLLLKTGAPNTPDTERATSVNPAWRKTLWHLLAPAAWLPGTPDNISSRIASASRAAMDAIKAPLSVQAAYLNEADPDEPDWQKVFFGDNYDRLLAIKRKWDPDTALNSRTPSLRSRIRLTERTLPLAMISSRPW
ncbi:FAD-binding domain-containing protein [Trichoderma citrinoviride]|uniref:FAD-binding domain-containing protein n=1 Tax=Trichoderma citrinoviride TaxID=58853 RepID=A0A2T4B708_9HYPO|nr:FAD-binding domain-containing protein [Trichoderma citrinoviride]PTB65114.1 FAD-binding domain-containing protein [Trichoderma citrinoviride]